MLLKLYKLLLSLESQLHCNLL